MERCEDIPPFHYEALVALFHFPCGKILALQLFICYMQFYLYPVVVAGGCPVIRGNKWSSTKWMHIHEYKA
jgi:hypothetical protein